jgi:hypothetical protein
VVHLNELQYSRFFLPFCPGFCKAAACRQFAGFTYLMGYNQFIRSFPETALTGKQLNSIFRSQFSAGFLPLSADNP